MLCYACQQLVVVTLPLYVKQLGESPIIAGLVFSSFSFTSFIVRPLIGHLSDRWSARGTLFYGSAILGLFGAAFVVPSLWVMFIGNTLRGIGWGTINTASSAAVGLIAPAARRGEASGYFGTSTTVAQSFAPAFALWLLGNTHQFSLVFVSAGVVGLLAMISVALMPTIGSGTETFRGAMAQAKSEFTWSTFMDRPVLLASVLLLCVTMSGPVTFAFVPLHAAAIGVQNIGLYFVAAGAASILIRIAMGRMMDQRSRGFWLIIGYVVLILGFGVFIVADRIELFLVAAVVNALALSLTQPTLMALAMDRAEPGRMGRAMATFSMFYRVGDGLGAPLAGTLIVLFGYPGRYVGAAAIAVVGIILAVLNWGVLGRENPQTSAS
jgi:MFS family permease